jgi:peptidyl-prolyl cis-trans isomerase A (cyclophilin A)
MAVIGLNISGNALDNSIKVYANDASCIVSPPASASNRSATCILTVPASLNLPVRITSASDYTVYSTTLTVPAPQVTFKTSLGDFVMELNPAAAPISVKNFLSYVNKSPSFYNNTIFHRVISGFVVQGGGFTTGMTAKTGLSTAITLESNNGLTNNRGTVAMARSTDANSATSQFYVNLVDNTSLNYVSAASPGYAVFGRVISGMDVIDTIATKPTGTVNGYANVPVTDITVTSATQTQ